MLINLWLRPAMILIPLCAGAFFPQCHVMEGCIRWGLIFMLFMSYLRIQLNQLTPRKAHWYILALNFAMGIIPFLTIRALGPEYTSLAQSAFFIGITPTATAAPVIVSFLHGRVSFTVTGFLITNFFISFSFNSFRNRKLLYRSCTKYLQKSSSYHRIAIRNGCHLPQVFPKIQKLAS